MYVPQSQLKGGLYYPSLLLNPPSRGYFMPLFVGFSRLENVAHFFHFISYTLTCLVSGVRAVVLTVVLSEEVSWRRRYVGCPWQEVVGCIVEYRLQNRLL